MKRRLFNIVAALSLFLFCVIVTLWIRSYWLSDHLTWTRSDGQRAIRTREGYFEIDLLLADWSGRDAASYGIKYSRDIPFFPSVRVYTYPDSRDKVIDWEHFGFEYYKRTRFDGVVYIAVLAPFWSVALATSLLPLIWIILRLRRLRRAKSGICPTCGYDLRATPDLCPECGTTPCRKT